MRNWSRRTFLKTQTSLAAGLGIGLPKLNWLHATGTPTKLILRADHLGESEATNAHAFRAIEEGLITSVNVQLDAPATVAALERLRQYPWLSIGWQTTDPTAANLHQLLADFRSQMLLSVRILGRAPDTGPDAGAATQVAKEFGVQPTNPVHTTFRAATQDPMPHLRGNTHEILRHETVQLAFDPAVHGPFLGSPDLRRWIRQNRIELTNHRDALFGTCEYQNRLRFLGSDLYMRDSSSSTGI